MSQITRSDFPPFFTKGGLALLDKMDWGPQQKLLSETDTRPWYFNVNSTTDPYWGTWTMVGVGSAARQDEGRPPKLVKPGMGRTVTAVFPESGIAIAISRQSQEDDQKNMLVRFCTRELSIAIDELIQDEVADMYNLGTTYRGWEADGKAVFATDHPLLKVAPDGTRVFSNKHPTNAALTQTSLDAAVVALMQVFNDSGRRVRRITPKYLDVAPALYPYAQQLMRTPRQLDTNYNNVNIHQGTLEIRVNPRFTVSTMWCLQAEHNWLWFNRVAPQFIRHIDEIGGNTIIASRVRYGYTVADPRGKYISRGA